MAPPPDQRNMNFTILVNGFSHGHHIHASILFPKVLELRKLDCFFIFGPGGGNVINYTI